MKLKTKHYFLKLATEMARTNPLFDWPSVLSETYRHFLLYNGWSVDLLKGLSKNLIADGSFKACLWKSNQPLEDIAAYHDVLLSYSYRPDKNEVLQPIGSLRKKSGAYYTPEPLVNFMLDQTLDPLMSSGSPYPRVCDPACGVGHFIIPATKRIALYKSQRESIPYDKACHWVVSNCIFGVDLDELALEICKLRLANEANMSTISFNLKCKNALIGEWPHIERFKKWFSPLKHTDGIDLILGNPPWERIKLSEREYFSNIVPQISNLKRKHQREKAIAILKEDAPEIYSAFQQAKNNAQNYATEIRNRYPMCGKGDGNLYAAFAELALNLLSKTGQCALVLPTGIVTDKTYSQFINHLIGQQFIRFVYGFDSKSKIFNKVSMQFCILGFGKQVTNNPTYSFQLNSLTDISPERTWNLSEKDYNLCNPTTKTLPNFKSALDAKIVIDTHRRFPVLKTKHKNPWNIELKTQYHMSSHSDLFKTENDLIHMGAKYQPISQLWLYESDDYVPLLEGKCIHQFTSQHRKPRYWIKRSDIQKDITQWQIAYRWIARNTDKRTLIATLMPPWPAGNSLGLIRINHSDIKLTLALLTLLNSKGMDYLIRQKLAGANITFGVLSQLPLPTPNDIMSSSCLGDNPIEQLAAYAKDKLMDDRHLLKHSSDMDNLNLNHDLVNQNSIMTLLGFCNKSKERVSQHFK